MTSLPHSCAKSVTPGGSIAGHTPGPWWVFSNSIGVGVTSPEHDDVAHCSGFNSRRLRAEEEANARLIAAAPELLEALRGLLGNAELARFHLQGTEEGMLVGSALFDTIQQARAAIAKATAGETRNAEGAL